MGYSDLLLFIVSFYFYSNFNFKFLYHIPTIQSFLKLFINIGIIVSTNKKQQKIHLSVVTKSKYRMAKYSKKSFFEFVP